MEHVRNPTPVTVTGMLSSDLKKFSTKIRSSCRVRSSIVRTDVCYRKTDCRRTLRVRGFNNHGYARMDWIGNDKVIILVRFFLYDSQYTFDLKGR